MNHQLNAHRKLGNADTDAGSPLDKYTTNLNEEALRGRIDPLIGRELELERTIQTLCRRRKNNPLIGRRSGCW